jgi:hypothetical protein
MDETKRNERSPGLTRSLCQMWIPRTSRSLRDFPHLTTKALGDMGHPALLRRKEWMSA